MLVVHTFFHGRLAHPLLVAGFHRRFPYIHQLKFFVLSATGPDSVIASSDRSGAS